MVKRKTTYLRHGDVIDVEEYHDGNYGAPGKRRQKREKPTEEQIRVTNARNKMRRCRLRLLEYFSEDDCFLTWTYAVGNRPPDMETALKDFQAAMGKVRRAYRKRGKELRWIRNIEQGTKGAWHIHLVVNEIGDTASILQKAWTKGGVYLSRIRLNDKIYDEDFTRLASYLTKDENSRREKADGGQEKPRIRDASYGTSRNMPLPEPKVTRLVRWRKEPKTKDGYYMARIYEGINPVTGYRYRRYTMIRIRGKHEKGRHLRRNNRARTGKAKKAVRLRP